MTPEQQRALEHALDFLAESPGSIAICTGPLASEWYAAARSALRDVVRAFEEPQP
jgi:hypothetical protein